VTALRLALAFLTRLPVGRADDDATDLFRAVCWFPFVGFALGGALAGGAWLLAPIGEPLVAAVVLVAWHALVTGGLHLDGVSDWFDAVGGGRGDRQRMLEIMRDPHAGAHGVAALCLVLIAKVALFAALLRAWDVAAWLVLPAAARAAVVPLAVLLPAARPDGLAHALAAKRSPWALIAAAGWMGGALAYFGAWPLGPAIAGAFAAALAVGLWARARIGGVTGDVHGVAIELSEVAFGLAWLVGGAS
jgi:adenosylcobinamide-GDP ribazoletransferase